jgi:hypothetical protein
MARGRRPPPGSRRAGRAGRQASVRRVLVSALAARGIEAAGDSGLGVWVPLAEEAERLADALAGLGRAPAATYGG